MKNLSGCFLSSSILFAIAYGILVFAGCGDLSQSTDATANAKANAPDPYAHSAPTVSPVSTPTLRSTLELTDVLDLNNWLLNGRTVGTGSSTSASYCVSFEFVHLHKQDLSELGRTIVKTDNEYPSKYGTYFSDCSYKPEVSLYLEDKETKARFLIMRVTRTVSDPWVSQPSDPVPTATPMPVPTPSGANVYFTYYTGSKTYLQKTASFCEVNSNTLSTNTVLKIKDYSQLGSIQSTYGCVLQKISNNYYCDLTTPADPYSTCTKRNSCTEQFIIGSKVTYVKYYGIYCSTPSL